MNKLKYKNIDGKSFIVNLRDKETLSYLDRFFVEYLTFSFDEEYKIILLGLIEPLWN